VRTARKFPFMALAFQLLRAFAVRYSWMLRSVSDVSVQKKILVVEDVADTRKLFALSLRHYGFEVFEAIDGIEGLERTATVHPDLIIMDIRMPRMDGLEAMTRLKADPAPQNIPILFATANTDQIEIQTLREAGACDVLIKPIE